MAAQARHVLRLSAAGARMPETVKKSLKELSEEGSKSNQLLQLYFSSGLLPKSESSFPTIRLQTLSIRSCNPLFGDKYLPPLLHGRCEM